MRRHGPPPFVIEFEPIIANTLNDEASKTFAIGIVGALALMLVALVLFRLVLLREKEQAHIEREKKLANLGEMSAVLAHEIRNPLASLKGHAQLLVEKLPSDSKERDKAERVVHEALRLERLSTDLLDFVGSGDVRRESCDPKELLHASAKEVAPDKINIHDEEAPNDWSLDSMRMQQVLSNVLRNAIEASPQDEQVDAHLLVVDKMLCFRVRDRGNGITKEEAENIFRPFHTTRVKGTGLGLAVASRLVALHHGEIRVSNHPEGGALFEVLIPSK